MRLTPAQVTLLREAEHQFLGNVASRGTNYHIAMEEFVAEVLKIARPSPVPGPTEAERLAQRFHEIYEDLAGSFGYETRKESAVPWEKVPERNKLLMVAVCRQIIVENALDIIGQSDRQQAPRPATGTVSDTGTA